MAQASNSPWQPHVASGSRDDGQASLGLVNHEITGTVRWLDVDLARVVVHVEDTDSHAGRFLGTDTTVNLIEARVEGGTLPDLTPGVRLRVKFRLSGDHGASVPDLVEAQSAYVE